MRANPRRRRSRPADLRHLLRQLESVGMIRPVPGEEAAFTFRHTLTQEAAYHSLLQQTRRTLHARVAHAVEAVFPEHVADNAPALARHYSAAGDLERTVAYATRAAESATRLHAHREAADLYALALRSALELASPGPALMDLFLRRGRSLELGGRSDEALAVYRDMEQVAQARSDRKMETEAILAQAVLHATPTRELERPRAQELAEKVLDLGATSGDLAAEAKALWILMLLHEGEPLQAIAYGERAITIARQAGLKELLAFALNDVAFSYLMTGDPRRARSTRQEALDLWRDLENLPMVADNMTRQAFELMAIGEFEAAMATAQEGDALAQRIGNAWGRSNFQGLIGMIHFEWGEIDRADEALGLAIRFGTEAGYFGAAMFQVARALMQLYLGLGDRVEQALRALPSSPEGMVEEARLYTAVVETQLHMLREDFDQAEASVQVLRATPMERVLGIGGPAAGQALLAVAELAVARGRPAEARGLLEEQIAFLAKIGFRLFRPDALRLLGLAAALEGERSEARRALEAAEAEARAMKSRRSLWRILRDRAALEEAEGHLSASARRRAEAEEIVAYIAGTLTDEASRNAFAAHPQVRELRARKPIG